MIVVNPSTRQFNIPGADLVFGVESDSGSERKYFQCPRHVGNNLDLAGSFIRMNYRNANGEIDSYLVQDVAADGDNVTFSWLLSPKTTMYKGQLSFVMCVVGPDTKVQWHTTLGRGQVLEGLEPDSAIVEEGTADVVAQLIAMVETQTATVEKTGADQVAVVKAAAKAAQDAAVAEIEAKRVNSLNSIPNDYTAMQRDVDDLARGRAGAIVCEAAGPVVAVNDASDMAFHRLRIFGRSTQDGVPTPDAPVEIKSVESPVVTVAGKNLMNPDGETQTSFGVTLTNNGDGSFSVVGTSTSSATFRLVDTEKNTIALHKGVAYTQSIEVLSGTKAPTARVVPSVWTPSGDAIQNYFKDNQTVIPDDEYTIRSYSFYVPNGLTVDYTFRVQLEVGDAATAYEPYKPVQTVVTTNILHGVPVESGGNYTDENGQHWICDEVDLNRGVLIKRLVSHTLTGDMLMYVWTDTERERGITVRGLPMDYSTRRDPMALCSHYRTRANGSIDPGQVGIRLLGDYTSLYFLHEKGVATTMDEWRAFFDAQVANGTPVTVLVKAEQETEIPLSETEIAAYRALHTNKPNTTILNGSGAHMKVEYAADTKLYIDNKFAALMGN